MRLANIEKNRTSTQQKNLIMVILVVTIHLKAPMFNKKVLTFYLFLSIKSLTFFLKLFNYLFLLTKGIFSQ